LIKIIILEENFKWHLEAFASELFVFYFCDSQADLCQLHVLQKLFNMMICGSRNIYY